MSSQLQLTYNDDFEQLLNSMQIFPIPQSCSVLDLIKTRSSEKMRSKAPNSYFVYRKVINDQLKDQSIKLSMPLTSALTSYGWRKASPEVKYAYEQLSKECEKVLNLRRNKELVWNPKPKESKGIKKSNRKPIELKSTKPITSYGSIHLINFGNDGNNNNPSTPAQELIITSPSDSGSSSSASPYQITNNGETNPSGDDDILYNDIPYHNSSSHYGNDYNNDNYGNCDYNLVFFSPSTPTKSDFQTPVINEQFWPHCYLYDSPPDNALIDFSLQNSHNCDNYDGSLLFPRFN